jgi:DNA transformation protein
MSAAPRGDSFRDFVLEQLGEVAGLRCRAMFGGHGLWAGDRFFAVLHRGRLYFKTDARSRKRYEEAGMGMFRPGGELALKTYFEVPASAIEDRGALAEWAREAISCARARSS